MNTRENSPIRFCTYHEIYYVSPAHDAQHKECEAKGSKDGVVGPTYALQWDEVTYYLDKLRRIRRLFGDLRTELNV